MENKLTLFDNATVDGQQKTWHIGLSNELQSSLKQRAVNIQLIYLQATMSLGRELAEAQKELSYKNGGFVKWCEEEARVDHQRAYEYIQIWENFKMLPLSGNILDIGKKVLLAASKKDVPQSARQEIVERHEAGQDITMALADDIIRKHKEEVEAERQRADQAEEEKKLTQQLLFSERSQSQEEIDKLNLQITALKKEKDDLSKPDEVIKEVDKPETIKRIEELEAEIKKTTQQRDNLSQLVDELSADLDVKETQREQEARALKIRQEWQKATETMYKNINQFLGKLPLPLDTQVFDTDDWAMLDQVEESFQRAIAACRLLRLNQTTMFVEVK